LPALELEGAGIAIRLARVGIGNDEVVGIDDVDPTAGVGERDLALGKGRVDPVDAIDVVRNEGEPVALGQR
jgi:hypothetical protein